MILVDNQYFGCINYFEALSRNKNCLIDQFEQFEKMSFRNRCVIVGSNGLITLSIPIEGGRNVKHLIRDVKICYTEDWPKHHWKAIRSSYGNAPFYDFYSSDLETLINKKEIFLFDKNWSILEWCLKTLKINTSISLVDTNCDTMAGKNYSNFKQKWLPKNYQLNQKRMVSYQQVFQDKIGFQPNVSILDLIFCEGPNAGNLLKC